MAELVYFHVEKLFSIKRLEIPELMTSPLHLRRIFGVGAETHRDIMRKRIYEKVGVTCKWSEYNWPLSKWTFAEMMFQGYVQLMKRSYESSKLE